MKTARKVVDFGKVEEKPFAWTTPTIAYQLYPSIAKINITMFLFALFLEPASVHYNTTLYSDQLLLRRSIRTAFFHFQIV